MAVYKRKNLKKRGRARLLKVIPAVVLAIAALGMLITLNMDAVRRETMRLYPMEYEAQIRAAAAEYQLDPAYVAAVVLTESGFDPSAVSSVGAQGLMQIMPETGEWIAGKLDETCAEGALFNPETNLRYGCWYLRFLLDRYDGDMTCASAAYHSGQGAVDQWLRDPAYSSDGRTLDAVKGTNADAYVHRIMERYEKYAKLYHS